MSTLLYQQIARQLADDIRKGFYKPGERVPSVRKLSAQKGVSHATVLQAYATLEDQGLVRARPQSGYYVHQAPALIAPPPVMARVEPPHAVTRSGIISEILRQARRDGTIPLGAAVPSSEFLPLRALHQHMSRVTRFHGQRAFSYTFSPGFEPLRRQVAIRMRDAGALVEPDQVVITSGCVEALQLCLRTLTRPGDLIAIESPGYYGLLQLCELLGLQVIEIPTHPETGLCLDTLARAAQAWPIKTLVVTTRAGNPMGATMSETNQRRLVAMMAQRGIPIIEDDIYGELMFDHGRTRALKAFDCSDTVLYCSSFSKTISPGVRTGWVIAGKYQEQIEKLQTFTTLSASSVSQMAVAAYLENGGYDRHLRHIRQQYRDNLACFQLAVQQHFPEGTRITRPRGGFILWLSLPEQVDTLSLFNLALEQNISIAPGIVFSNSDQFNHCLRLNCGIPWNRDTERAIVTLGLLAKGLLDGSVSMIASQPGARHA